MDFLHTGRQLSFASSVYNVNVRTKAKSRSGCVHGYVSAADDTDFLSDLDRCVIVITECLHQIISGQILVGGEDAQRALARDAHEHRQTGAGTDEDSFEAFLFHQLVDRDGFADDDVGLDLYTKPLDVLDLLVDNIDLRQTEFRNAISQHTACFVQCLKDRDIIAPSGQVTRTGKACRAGADDSYLVPVLFFGRCRPDAVFSGPVRCETFQFADGDRIALDAADAVFLTLALLRTYAAADCRQRRGFRQHFIGFLEIAFLYAGDEFRDIDVYRAPCDAFRILAMDTPCGFRHGLLSVIAIAYFVKVLRSCFRFLFSDRDSFQYVDFHNDPPPFPHEHWPQPPSWVSPSCSFSIARPSSVLYICILCMA